LKLNPLKGSVELSEAVGGTGGGGLFCEDISLNSSFPIIVFLEGDTNDTKLYPVNGSLVVEYYLFP
jgi:hypothetical protein